MKYFGLVLLVALCACAPTISHRHASEQRFPARAADCTIELLSLPPQRPFTELGTFDIEVGDDLITTTSELLEYVRGRACAHGAHAIVAVKSGDGYYVQATELRWRDQE